MSKITTRISKAHEKATSMQNRETNRAARVWSWFELVMKLANWLAVRAADHITLARAYDEDRKDAYEVLKKIRARHDALAENRDAVQDDARAIMADSRRETKMKVKAAATTAKIAKA